MKPNLIDSLRCSPTLQPPAATELATWFGAQQPQSAQGDSSDDTAVRVRPRRASLSLVLRQVEGEVQMLAIKRAVSLRCEIHRTFTFVKFQISYCVSYQRFALCVS